jgi:hypothetical protein
MLDFYAGSDKDKGIDEKRKWRKGKKGIQFTRRR